MFRSSLNKLTLLVSVAISAVSTLGVGSDTLHIGKYTGREGSVIRDASGFRFVDDLKKGESVRTSTSLLEDL